MMTLERLLQVFSREGVARAYFKRLAANDNSKNQIYVGPGFHALNSLPVGTVRAVASGTGGREVFHAAIRLSWVTGAGNLAEAPEARLILYPQYPEVRLSGFLKRSTGAPSSILRSRRAGRILVLGVTSDGRVIGFAGDESSPVARALDSGNEEAARGILELPLAVGRGEASTRDQILREFRRIHSTGWINSRRLSRDGMSVPCEAPQCGGYTLEAELGITPNSMSEPDFLGWEVKQFGVQSFNRPTGVLTLMTPEPDGGYYRTGGVVPFVRRYGYSDQHGRADRLNFGGTHYVGRRHETTGLALTLDGFDAESGLLKKPSGCIALVDHRGNVAASWAFEKLIAHWRRKHTNALFAMSRKRSTPRRQYWYGPKVWLGTNTDFLKLLAAFAAGNVYYDPGIKVTGASTRSPESKRRSQFRVRFGSLESLYGNFEPVNLVS